MYLYSLWTSPLGASTYTTTYIHLSKATLAKFPFYLVHWRPANLYLHVTNVVERE